MIEKVCFALSHPNMEGKSLTLRAPRGGKKGKPRKRKPREAAEPAFLLVVHGEDALELQRLNQSEKSDSVGTGDSILGF